MIEMTWAALRDNDLQPALHKIARAKVEFKTGLKIVGILKALDEEKKKSDEMFKVITDKHYELSEDKNFLKPKKEEEEEAKKAMAEFNGTKFSLKYPKLKSTELSKVELSAIEILKIESLLEIDGENNAQSPEKK